MLNMLQDVTTADQISRVMVITFGKVIVDDRKAACRVMVNTIVFITWIEAKSSILSQFAQQRQKVSLSASDIDYILVVKIVILDQPLSQLFGVALKTR